MWKFGFVEDVLFVLMCGINDIFGVINIIYFSLRSVCSIGLVSIFICCFELEMFMNFFFFGCLMGWMGKVEFGRNVVNICKEFVLNSRKIVIWGNILFRRWFFGKWIFKMGLKYLFIVLCWEVCFLMDYLEKVKVWYKEGRWIGIWV